MIDAQAALDRVSYRNYTFTLREAITRYPRPGESNLMLRITFVDEDLRVPHAPAKTWAWETSVDELALESEDKFYDWLLTEVITTDLHEICEGFHVDGIPHVDPHTDGGKTWTVGI